MPEDETIYFVLIDRFENGDRTNDRGGLTGDRLRTGFDPTDKRFYHGGDLRDSPAPRLHPGARRERDLVGPIYKNKPVQGAPGRGVGRLSWLLDHGLHTRRPTFGSNEDLAHFIAAAHARDMKVYLDIVTNHTADVIAYRECLSRSCPIVRDPTFLTRVAWRPRPDNQAEINPGFAGDHIHTPENFAKLTDARSRIRPLFHPPGQVKVPAWLNDPIWYHNRGNTTFRGESMTMGDFGGLDDLMTENPRVVQGFIEIYGAWIDRFGVDGFRIDTARHVNPEFWQAFVPAMLDEPARKESQLPYLRRGRDLRARHRAPGSRHPRRSLPTVLDFAFRATALGTLAGDAGTDTFVKLFDGDALYEAVRRRRVGCQRSSAITITERSPISSAAFPRASDDEVLERTKLAHAMLFTLRGVPVLYAGDEQGFAGDGNDADAREDMFASAVASL